MPEVNWVVALCDFFQKLEIFWARTGSGEVHVRDFVILLRILLWLKRIRALVLSIDGGSLAKRYRLLA